MKFFRFRTPESSNASAINTDEVVPSDGFAIVNTPLVNVDAEDFGGSFILPSYASDISPAAPQLNYADCTSALCNSVKKARVILFETARQRQPSYAIVRGRAIALLGPIRSLDESLAYLQRESKSPQFGPKTVIDFSKINERVLADKRVAKALASTNITLLRLDKLFRSKVVQVLKMAMIDGISVDHIKLEAVTSEITRKTEEASHDLTMEWFTVALSLAPGVEKAELLSYIRSSARWMLKHIPPEAEHSVTELPEFLPALRHNGTVLSRLSCEDVDEDYEEAIMSGWDN